MDGRLALLAVHEWRLSGSGANNGPPFSLQLRDLMTSTKSKKNQSKGNGKSQSQSKSKNQSQKDSSVNTTTTAVAAAAAPSIDGDAADSGFVEQNMQRARSSSVLSPLADNRGRSRERELSGDKTPAATATATTTSATTVSSAGVEVDDGAMLSEHARSRPRRGTASADASPVGTRDASSAALPAAYSEHWKTLPAMQFPEVATRIDLNGDVSSEGEEILLVLIRHGESEANQCTRAQVSYGGIDAPLTPLGTAQAEALSASGLIKRWDVQRVIVSPLRRALATAARVFQGPTAERIVALPALTEFGGFDQANRAVSLDVLRTFVAEDLGRREFPVVDLDQVREGWWTSKYCDDVSRLYELLAYIQAAPERRFAAVAHYCTIAEILRLLGFASYAHPHNCSPVEIRLRRTPLARQFSRVACRIHVEPRNWSAPLMEELALLDMVVQDLIVRNGAPPSDLAFLEIVIADGVQVSAEQQLVLLATLKAFCSLLHSERRGAFHLGPVSPPHLHSDVRANLVCRVECRTMKLLASLIEDCLNGGSRSGSNGPVLDLRWFNYPGSVSREMSRWLESSQDCRILATVVSTHDIVIQQSEVWQQALRDLRWRVCVTFDDRVEQFDI